MPVITIAMQTISDEKKKMLITNLTRAAAQATEIPESSFIVFVDEHAQDAIGIGGRTLKEVIASRA